MTNGSRSSFWLDWLLAALAASPFLSLYVQHFYHRGDLPTGFLTTDMAYYSANGRAVFERGNGLAYPNPYDPDTQGPVIYFHWFFWLLGFGITRLHLDPGIQYVALGVIAAVTCAWLTLHLVRFILPTPRYFAFLYLITMWGGGLLCLGAVALNAWSNVDLFDDLLRFDPAGGDWCLNWGRNLVYPTESIYHALMAASWLALLAGRWHWALLAVVALAATHPFTGLQALLILLAWTCLLFLIDRNRQGLFHCLILLAMASTFVWYYAVYLESFREHRTIRQEWSLDWSLGLSSMVLAYALAAVAALARILTDRIRLNRAVAFLLLAFAVSFLLANHNWFMLPRQPLHFTRGYVWMSLWLIGLPMVQRGMAFLRQRGQPIVWALLIALGTAITVFDNSTFLSIKWRQHDLGLYLSPSEWDALKWMNQAGIKGTLLCPDGKVSYLSATYTAARPYCGHPFNTPQYSLRVAEIRELFDLGKAGPWLSGVDYILVPRPLAKRVRLALEGTNRSLRLVYENDQWVLFAFALRHDLNGNIR
jgi:hypothetical protein